MESKPRTLIVLFRPVGSQRPRLGLLLVTEGPSPQGKHGSGFGLDCCDQAGAFTQREESEAEF